MVQLDPSLNAPTPTGEVAERADCVLIAQALLTKTGHAAGATPEDLLELARFLANG